MNAGSGKAVSAATRLCLPWVVQVNWVGSAIFTFFVLAFGFYLWVRITKTMDLGQYLAYGIYVLVVEARFIPRIS